MIKKSLLIILISLSVLNAKELQAVFSNSMPPYVFKDGSGIVITIVKEALAGKSHTIKPLFVNIGRSIEMFKYGYVDSISIIKKSSGLKAYYSEYFMQYHSAAFALKSNKCNIQKIADLKNYYLIAFENATKYLGQDFAKIAKDSRNNYSEVFDQKQQVYKLLQGRTDVVVMDINVFTFYKNELIAEGKVDKDIEVELFELFEPTQYRTAFKDKKIRDDFNEGIKKLKKSGRCKEIYNIYGSKYFQVRK